MRVREENGAKDDRKRKGTGSDRRRSDGGAGQSRRDGETEAQDDMAETDGPMSAENDSLPLFLWPHMRATRHTITPIPDIPPGPGRAREATLRAGARGTIRHAVSPTAPAPLAEVRARVAKRPEKRSLGS